MHQHTCSNLFPVSQSFFSIFVSSLIFFSDLNLCIFAKYLTYAFILVVIKNFPYSKSVVFATFKSNHALADLTVR